MVVILILMFAAPCCLGVGAARLMFYFFGLARRLLSPSPKELFTYLSRILGWFLGSTAVTTPMLFLTDFNEAAGDVPWGEALVCLGYLCGFGLTTAIIAVHRELPFMTELRHRMTGLQLEALLLILAMNVDPEDAAQRLGVSEEEAAEAYHGAMLTLKRRHAKIADALKELQVEAPETGD